MNTQSLSAQAASPPPAPPFPPPVPPPFVDPLLDAGTERLWRWNDRLALTIGGLTIFLIGIVTGRVISPEQSASVVAGIPAVVSASETASTSLQSSPEENPPELVITPAAIVSQSPPVSSQSETPKTTTVQAEALLEFPTLASAQDSKLPLAAAVTTASIAPPPAAVPSASPVGENAAANKAVATIRIPVPAQVCTAEEKFKDRKLDTALTWAESVDEANQQAKDQDKLVFLIHVSGNFEMPGFT